MFEVTGARALAERLSTSSIIRDYDVAWGRYRAANVLLNGPDAIWTLYALPLMLSTPKC
ncbi:hypothetical protein OAL10_00370 [Gammaproteobacteria bacterium]|nr:hypothetical protein [Gammaproteobacteria bacterium]